MHVASTKGQKGSSVTAVRLNGALNARRKTQKTMSQNHGGLKQRKAGRESVGRANWRRPQLVKKAPGDQQPKLQALALQQAWEPTWQLTARCTPGNCARRGKEPSHLQNHRATVPGRDDNIRKGRASTLWHLNQHLRHRYSPHSNCIPARDAPSDRPAECLRQRSPSGDLHAGISNWLTRDSFETEVTRFGRN